MHQFFSFQCHIILLFSFIDPGQCQVLKVELKNDAYESQSSRVGIYKLSSTVNGRPSWTKSGSQARYIYIRIVRSIATRVNIVLFKFVTFNSFLAGLDRNRIYGPCCSAQMAQQPLQYYKRKLITQYHDLEGNSIHKLYCCGMALQEFIPQQQTDIYSYRGLLL